MAYLRWSFSNWYVYWDCAGYVQVYHVDGGDGRYNFNSDIDEFIEQEFNNVSDEDKNELKIALNEANEDYKNSGDTK